MNDIKAEKGKYSGGLAGNIPIKKAFFAFLVPSMFATLTNSIYTLADTIMIGQYEGDAGLYALNIILPLYSFLMGLGVLFGVGGGVLYSVALGRGEKERAKKIFTSSLISVLAITVVSMVMLNVFFYPIINAMGAEGGSVELISSYGRYVTLGAPLFVYAMFMQAFVRNDNNPRLAMIAVISGGVLNILLDYIFVFPLDMGMDGAALATLIGYAVNCLILSTHFFRKKCGLKLCRSFSIKTGAEVALSGFPSFIAEIAAGIVILTFNIQLLKYIGSTGVVVYGVISNVAIVGMSLFNGVAQACQPIISANYGANRHDRIKKVTKMGIISAILLGIFLCLIAETLPLPLLNLFSSNPSQAVIDLTPLAVRTYFSGILFNSLNIFFIIYYQSTVKSKTAFALSLMRGVVLSVTFVLVFPLIFGGNAIFAVMPATEILTFIVAVTIFVSAALKEKRKNQSNLLKSA